MFRSKERNERIRLLEYENKILKHRVDDLVRRFGLKEPKPIPPFTRLESNGRMLPTYEELKHKYR